MGQRGSEGGTSDLQSGGCIPTILASTHDGVTLGAINQPNPFTCKIGVRPGILTSCWRYLVADLPGVLATLA
ncbi:hypothetical protein ElyMa_002872900 [Elysia marginata]|uniref:Uncharacterized protein n=1 Tax=Elysia marginata TaxID=1093978 RepID=A0AAV4HX84_9GAST|nr:hypothetical protein ElyMa_002872900 [Elysia marginata]